MADEIAQPETTPRPGPALSATSDAPTADRVAPPLSAVGGTTGELLAAAAEEAEKPEAEAPPEEEAPAAEEEAPAAEEKPEGEEAPPVEVKEGREDRGVGKKLNALELAKTAAEAKAAEEKGRADELARQLEAERARKVDEKPVEAKPEAPVDDPRPTRPRQSAFETPDAYDNALDKYDADFADWNKREARREAAATIVERETKAKTAEAEERAATEIKGLTEAFAEHRNKFVETMPDYVDVVEKNDKVQITNGMWFTALNSGAVGPAIVYHLGKNPDEAARIAALPTPRQIFEIGQIAARLTAPAEENPAPKVVSKAPPPVKPLAARNRAADKDPTEMSMEEYAAFRSAKPSASARTH